MRLILTISVSVVAAWLASLILGWWLNTPAPSGIEPRTPEAARASAPLLAPDEHCNRIISEFSRLAPDPVDQAVSGSWPGFRGRELANVVTTGPTLAETWPAEGPLKLWETSAGDGHAGPAVFAGRVYLMDYDEENRRDTLRCLSLQDGQDLWRRSYPVVIKRNHGVSRTVPAVNDDVVLTFGPKCQVMCVDRQTGDFRWGLDLVRDYGSSVPLWYAAQCPLIDENTAVIAPAGRDLLLGIDCTSGDILWRTPNPDGWAMSHSSVVIMTFGTTRAYVYAALGGIVAVRADAPRRGEVLWKTDLWNRKIVAPCPIQLASDRLFMTSGHGAGSAILQITMTGDACQVTGASTIDKTVFASEQQTPLWVDGLLYGILPKDGGEHREELVCFNPSDPGTVMWSSGIDHRFGLGPTIMADGKLFVLDDAGILSMLRVNSSGFTLLARAEVLPQGRDAWGPPALVDGKMLLRDSTRLICLDLRENLDRKD